LLPSLFPDLIREANQNFRVPGTDIVIDKGSNILIPVYNIHDDPNIHTEPEKFDTKAVKSRHPMAYLPFGDGPRNCIALRFGKIQSKIDLVRSFATLSFSH